MLYYNYVSYIYIIETRNRGAHDPDEGYESAHGPGGGSESAHSPSQEMESVPDPSGRPEGAHGLEDYIEPTAGKDCYKINTVLMLIHARSNYHKKIHVYLQDLS